MQDDRKVVLMSIWAVLLIVWVVGIPIAYIAMDRLDVAWMRRGQWTEESIANGRRMFRGTLVLLSLGSWFMVIGVVKLEVDDRRFERKLDRMIKETIRKQTPAILEYMREKEERNGNGKQN